MPALLDSNVPFSPAFSTTLAIGALLGAVLGVGCSDSAPGSVEVTVWGEEYIEEGIGAEEFDDGWAARYDAFHVVTGAFTVENASGGGGGIAPMVALDLTKKGPHTLGTVADLEPGTFDRVGYRIAPATGKTKRHSSLAKTDFERLVDSGYSLFVSGNVSKGDVVKRFAWGFTGEVRYDDCVSVRDGQEVRGIVVGTGANSEHQITIHGDHLFYDDIASDDAVLRFDALAAADADDDGEVTLQELAAVELSSLPASAGTYGVGAADVNTLAEFVTAATQSLGHFDGEGHCTARLVE